MSLEVVGAKQLVKKLQAIQKECQPKIVAQAVRAAMVPMMQEARANAPKGKRTHRTYKGRLVAPGFLKRNIKLRKMKFKDKSRVGYSLKARGEAWYGSLVETGHGNAKPKPWLGKAYRSKSEEVDSRFRQEMLKRINKAKR